MSKFTGVTAFALFSAIAFFQNPAQARNITVSGNGSEHSFCNANSGSFCMDRAKRAAEQDAVYEAQRVCEFTYRGRALRYTALFSTFCTPNYLPPRHDGTWVRCNSTARMQCEVN